MGMTDVSWRARQPKGQSTGGQFGKEIKRESDVSLIASEHPPPKSMFGDYDEQEVVKIAEKVAEKFSRQYWPGDRKVSHKDKQDMVQESLLALVTRVKKHGLPDNVPRYLMGTIASNMSRSTSDDWHAGDRKGYRVLKILEERKVEELGRKLTLKEVDGLADEVVQTWPKHAHLDKTNPREEVETTDQSQPKNPKKPRPGFQHRYQTLPTSLNLPTGEDGSQEMGELLPATSTSSQYVRPGSGMDQVFREVEDRDWVSEDSTDKDGRKVGHLTRAKKEIYNALAESYNAPIPRMNSVKPTEANKLLKHVKTHGFDDISDEMMFRAFGNMEKEDRIRVRKVFYKHPEYAQELWESTIRYATEQREDEVWGTSDDGYDAF